MAEVRVITYMGKSGGFATGNSKRWRVELQGANGQVHRITGPWGVLGDEAAKVAEYWCGLTDWPIVQYKERVEYYAMRLDQRFNG